MVAVQSFFLGGGGGLGGSYLLVVARDEVTRSDALLRRTTGGGTVGENLERFLPPFEYPAWFDNRTMAPVKVLGDAPVLRTWMAFEIGEAPRVWGHGCKEKRLS